MDLICYAAANCPEGAQVLTRLQAEAPAGRTVLCRTVEELDRSLLRPLDDVLAVVLFLTDDEDLAHAVRLIAKYDTVKIALLLGGVSRQHLLRAGMMDAMALLAAIASGLLASSRCRNFSRAAILALIYAALALQILGMFQSVF